MNRHSGFTMVELIITLVVASVLAAIAIPSFNDFIRDQRVSAEANEILTSLMFARTEAIKRNRRVTICKSTNPTAAEPVCNTAANPGWTTGWITYVDQAPDGQRAPATELLLRARGPVPGNMELTSTSADIALNISYVARGITQKIGGGSQSGTITVCEPGDPIKGRLVTLTQTGRAEVSIPAAPLASCP